MSAADDQREPESEECDPPSGNGCAARRVRVDGGRDHPEREEERLERERVRIGQAQDRGRAESARPALALVTIGAEHGEGAEGPEGDCLLDHHRHAGKPLVGQRRQPEQALVLGHVCTVERVEREEQHHREDLTGGEHADGVAEPAAARERAPSGRIDQLRPDEQAGDDEAGMLEIVERLVVEGGVVDGGHVPGGEREQPQGQADRRAEQEGDHGAQRPHPREGRERRSGEEEDDERSAHGEDEERCRGVTDEDVLEHVAREEVFLPDGVQGREERERRAGRFPRRTARHVPRARGPAGRAFAARGTPARRGRARGRQRRARQLPAPMHRRARRSESGRREPERGRSRLHCHGARRLRRRSRSVADDNPACDADRPAGRLRPIRASDRRARASCRKVAPFGGRRITHSLGRGARAQGS